MTRFRAATTRSLDAEQAAADLAQQLEKQGAESSKIAGGFLLATAAAGDQARAVGGWLGERWPEAELLGTSFEGIVGEGQVWRDEPALGLFVWEDAPNAPIPFVFARDELEVARVAGELLDAADRTLLGPSDQVLLFPDAMGSPGLPRFLEELSVALGGAQLAGAAASGLVGDPALAWSGEASCRGALVGLLLPSAPLPSPSPSPVPEQESERAAARISTASATRSASPWLEITACRTRWVDGLEEEPPIDWVRRQLGLDARARVEPYLDRLMVRVRRSANASSLTELGEEEEPSETLRSSGAVAEYDEQFLIGIDARRGAISLPGEFARGDELSLALPDADLARQALRESVAALEPSSLVLQFSCRARDEQLHGDRDVESALVAHHAESRALLGTLAPFQLGPGPAGAARLLVYSTVLAALGEADT